MGDHFATGEMQRHLEDRMTLRRGPVRKFPWFAPLLLNLSALSFVFPFRDKGWGVSCNYWHNFAFLLMWASCGPGFDLILPSGRA